MSCIGDLDVTNKSAVSSKSMWKEEGDAKAAMYGLYNQFRSTFSYGYFTWGEYRTGLWGGRPNRTNFKRPSLSKSNSNKPLF